MGSLGTDWASSLAVAPMLTAGTSDVILNRKVLIYAPYEAVWAPYNEGPALVSLFDASPLGLDVTYLQNQDATVEALQSLPSYGLVILATHGSQGIAFATGEIASASKKEEYGALREDGQIGVWTNVQVDETGAGLVVSEDVFVIYDSFIDNLEGSFPASLIVNNSCESTQSDALWRAFEAKGAEAYFGYSSVVSSSFAVDMVLELIEPMVSSELATTGDAFVAGQIDPSGQPAEFQMRGNEELHYGTTLVNGDFEFGNLDGWTRSGDGRGHQPAGHRVTRDQGNFMGIISTGLGFTETSGEISQLFQVDASTSSMTLRLELPLRGIPRIRRHGVPGFLPDRHRRSERAGHRVRSSPSTTSTPCTRSPWSLPPSCSTRGTSTGQVGWISLSIFQRTREISLPSGSKHPIRVTASLTR